MIVNGRRLCLSSDSLIVKLCCEDLVIKNRSVIAGVIVNRSMIVVARAHRERIFQANDPESGK